MLAPKVAIWENSVPSGERSILNPVSLEALSTQARLIWVVDAAPALRLVGAAGSAVTVLATFE